MEQQNLLDKIGSVCMWIIRLTYVNFLWILFTLLGVGILGIFPSTVSMFAIARKWVQGDSDFKILNRFWNVFKNEFIKANLLCYLIFLIGFILYVDLTVFEFGESFFFQIFRLIILSIVFLYLLILMYLIPMFVQYQFSLLKYIKYSLLFSLTSPIQTILLLVLTFFAYMVLMYWTPGLIIIFGGSVLSLGYMWITNKVFLKMEKQEMS